MADRTDEMRRSAEECARLADRARDPDVRREFRALARHFTELADHIDQRSLKGTAAVAES
jgi:hypothetical protein